MLTKLQVIRCCGCEANSFREVEECSEDYDGETGEIIPTIRAYPASEKDASPAKSFHNLPWKLGEISRETVDAFNQNCALLASAGIRLGIEGICADKGVADGRVTKCIMGVDKTVIKNDLQDRINGLQERRIITVQLQESLHEHRFLGNDALHELEPPTRDELRLAIPLLEHTLEARYEVVDRVGEEGLQKQGEGQEIESAISLRLIFALPLSRAVVICSP